MQVAYIKKHCFSIFTEVYNSKLSNKIKNDDVIVFTWRSDQNIVVLMSRLQSVITDIESKCSK